MQTWKKIGVFGGLAAALVVAGAGVSRAAGPEGPWGRRIRLIQALRALGVTPDQGRALKAAAVHLAVERRALNLEDLSAPERKERLFQLRRDFFARVDATLTADQKAKLKAWFEQGRAARAEQLRQRAAAFATQLQLTAEQRERAKDIIQQAKARIDQVAGDAAVDTPTRLATAIGVLEEIPGQIYRTLTPEQKEKAKGLLEAAIRSRLPVENLLNQDAP
ncbi:MAG: hypothetical protein HY320_12675 [Armatimonadetes bacterium]|nr:hypothetical protein [Armatimonadota bacterium]